MSLEGAEGPLKAPVPSFAVQWAAIRNQIA